MEIKENISLDKFSTFQIGGRIKYLLFPKTESEVIKAIKFAKEKKLPFFVFGGGSNVLFPDGFLNKIGIKIEISDFKNKDREIVCGAGFLLYRFVGETAKKGLEGIEWAAGIPGTIGGAIADNTGAFEGEMKDIVKEIEVLDTQKLTKKVLKRKDCQFSYRDSIFKKEKRFIILRALFSLKKGKKKKILKKIKENILYRKKHHPIEYPSLGSIFKNPKISFSSLKKEIRKEILDDIKKRKVKIKEGKIPAAYLIAKCNLSGKKIGGAEISKKHPNFIINIGGAKAQDVLALIDLIKKNVKRKFNISLEEEIIIVK